jgi:hypothetical protein
MSAEQPNIVFFLWDNLVDMYTTLVHAGKGTVPTDRQIDGMDMRKFLLGDAEESGRNTVLCIQGNRLQAGKWRQWKMHLIEQDVTSVVTNWVSGPMLMCSSTRRGPPQLGHLREAEVSARRGPSQRATQRTRQAQSPDGLARRTWPETNNALLTCPLRVGFALVLIGQGVPGVS